MSRSHHLACFFEEEEVCFKGPTYVPDDRMAHGDGDQDQEDEVDPLDAVDRSVATCFSGHRC